MAAGRSTQRAGSRMDSPADSPGNGSGSLDGLLAAKEIVIACGPGGVGKTTTMLVITGLLRPHSGRVVFEVFGTTN